MNHHVANASSHFAPLEHPGPTETKRLAANVDTHVGSRIRLRRIMMGLSQERLADYLGLTFQQVQKYEKGANRVSAGRLYQLAQLLDVTVSFFFDDMPGTTSGGAVTLESADLQRRDLELLRSWRAIESDEARAAIYRVVKAVADSGHQTSDLATQPIRGAA